MTDGSPVPHLKEPQRRHIAATCRYVDRALSDLEAVVAAASSGSPFARYVDDLTPAQKRLLGDYCAGIRAQMLRVLRAFGIAPGETMVSARHAIRTGVAYVEVALEELKPRYMRGYGEVPPEIAPELNGLVQELQALVDRLDRTLAQGVAADLQARLARLSDAGEGSDLLVTLERIIDRQGLVEFRPALDAILERYEDRRFEVAVFGRVSAGKSSLLNRLLGGGVLPVGVTPMTAVPTRIQFGPADGVELRFADRPAARTGLEHLAEYVTEQANPDNVKHVTRVVVTLNRPQLAKGVVFVDTPGLGSLAATGAAETLAYLPRCDLGVVLVDASTPLTPDDVSTVARLSEVGIPPMVLLSKADLVTSDDLARVVAYVGNQIHKALGLSVTVYPVSAMMGQTRQIDTWVADTLQPLFADHRVLVAQSLQRKVGVLRVGVEAALRARLGRGRAAPAARVDARPIEAELRQTAGLFEDVRQACDALRDLPPTVVFEALEVASEKAGHAMDFSGDAAAVDRAVQDAIGKVAADRREDIRRALANLAAKVQGTLARTAEALGMPEPMTADDWSRLMREMPQCVIGELHVDVRLFLRKALGAGVAHRRVRTAIQSQIGDRVAPALTAHVLALHDWSLRTLSRVRHSFDAQAEVYRAQLSQPAGVESNRASSSIEQDLATIADSAGVASS